MMIVLSVKPSPGDSAQQPKPVLTLKNLQVIQTATPGGALRFLKENPCDLVVYDLIHGSEKEGEEVEGFFREASDLQRPMVVAIPQNPAPELEMLMVRLRRIGPFEWLTGLLTDDSLFKVFDRILSHPDQDLGKSLFQKWGKGYQFQGMVGRSSAMLKIFGAIESFARYDTTVLITGETGTGKEMVAKAVHELSPRRAMRFVACNCAALPENLIESELFGHMHGGTIFLDEIGDMPLAFQAKLIRVIEEREIRPVGSDSSLAVDVRIVAATNQDLWQAVQSGRFRRDLFYRLNVARLELPALRDRREDIPILCDYYLDQIRRKNRIDVESCSDEAASLLIHYDWPGNVREFKNTLEAAALMATGEQLTIRDLPSNLQEYAITHQEKILQSSRPNSIEVLEKNHIQEVMSRCQGNKTNAAKELGLSRRALYRRLEKYELSF
jgi:transcriptional regulator with PAS, ATPase and Fis domain